MRRRALGILAWTPLAVTLLALGLAVAGEASTGAIPSEDAAFAWGVGAIGLTYVTIGGLVASRRPRHPIGWILAAIGLGQTFNLATGAWWYVARARSLPGAGIALWFGSWNWIPSVGLLVTFLLLLFPTGRPPSPRWRVVGWLAAAGLLVAPGSAALSTWRFRNVATPETELPLAPATAVGLVLIAAAAAGSLASLAMRYRRATGEERQQLRWFVGAAVITLLGLVLSLTIPVAWSAWFIGPGFVALAATTGIAILRYRLYDLDVVIRKTVVFAILVILIMAVSLALLFALSDPITTLFPDETQAVGIVGVVIGLLVWPLRRLAVRIADRVVFGGRASPYEVLTDLANRVRGTYSTEDILPRIARILAEATRAERATVWLRVGNELRPEADTDDPMPAPVPLTSEGLPEFAHGAHVYEARHQGELLGALSVTMSPSDPMDRSKERLISDLASQAGLVLRNVRLIEELRASRRRIVAAQDERAKRLERDLHDGAQQQLVALAVKLGLAENAAERERAERTRSLLGQLRDDANDALENLRDLARGIYPPLLAEEGLAPALEAQSRRSPVAVSLEADGVGRYGPDVEAAVYFCVLEALNNVAKYAEAASVTVRLLQASGRLEFAVVDDGRGFDPEATRFGTGLQGMADRLEAIGGRLQVESSPGRGTRIRGAVPVTPR